MLGVHGDLLIVRSVRSKTQTGQSADGPGLANRKVAFGRLVSGAAEICANDRLLGWGADCPVLVRETLMANVVDYCCSPSHDQCGIERPEGTSSRNP